MRPDELPYACLLCSPIALPFRNLWEARRHVRDEHPDEADERYPEEFLRVLPPDQRPPAPTEGEPPFACLHCQREGKLETRLNVFDIEKHVRTSHIDREYYNRMGIPFPLPAYGEDYLDTETLLRRLDEEVERFARQVQSLRTVTDLFTEFGLGFFNEPPEEP